MNEEKITLPWMNKLRQLLEENTTRTALELFTEYGKAEEARINKEISEGKDQPRNNHTEIPYPEEVEDRNEEERYLKRKEKQP